MRKKWVILPVGAGLAALAVVALLVWFGVEDARPAALLDARVREADSRVGLTHLREFRLVRAGAPAEEIMQADLECKEACKELDTLRTEQWRRGQSWHTRLLREARRRVGW